MKDSLAAVKTLMVELFNDILSIEETVLKTGKFNDLSVTEMHTIEAIGLHTKQTMSEVAKRLGITVGTLTVAINNLVNKCYVERFRLEDDRRVVLIGLTKKGRVLYRVHEKFHANLAQASIDGLTEDEEKVLTTALSKLHQFLLQKHSERLG